MKTGFPLLPRLLLVVLLPFAAAPAHAQLTDLLRSVSGAARGSSSGSAQQPAASTTLGVRGIDEPGALAGGSAVGDNAVLDGWTASPTVAEKAAAAKKLEKRQVTLNRTSLLPSPAGGQN
jgi:hypothetical protein